MTNKTTTPKSVDQLIKAAIALTGKSREAIQTACIAVLIHAEKHGDYSKASTLVNGLPDSIRKDSLVQWFVQFGGLTLPTEQSDTAFSGWQGADFIRANFASAKDTYWDTVKKPANPYKGFNLQEELLKLLKKADQERKKHGGDASCIVPDDLMAALSKVAGKI